MSVLDQIKERIAYQLSYWEDEPSAIHMSLSARMVSDDGKVEERAEVPLVTCKDCMMWSNEPQHPYEESQWCERYGTRMEPYDFCSRAWRREA